MYDLQLTAPAARVFKTFSRDVQHALAHELRVLRHAPTTGEPLTGLSRGFRSIHITHQDIDYCVIYQIAAKAEMVIILLVDTRTTMYRKLDDRKIKP